MKKLERLAVVGGLALMIAACGKKGALIYPDMLAPAAPSATTVNQSGSGVKLQFDLPVSDRAGSKLSGLAGVVISKRESDPGQDQTCRSCMTDYRLFRKLYLDLLPDGVQRLGKRLLVLDGDVRAGKLYSYNVVPFTKEGVNGSSSPPVSVLLVQPVLPPLLHAESFPTEIKLSFVGPTPREGSLVGHNLYRTSQKDTLPYLPINREPLKENEYVDSGLARGVTYRYQVRAVVKLVSGAVVESLGSNEVEGLLKDDE